MYKIQMGNYDKFCRLLEHALNLRRKERGPCTMDCNNMKKQWNEGFVRLPITLCMNLTNSQC